MARRSSALSDRALRARLSVASQEAFVREYWPGLVRFLKTRASNSRFAEDVAMQAMVAAFDRWDELPTYERPDCWLFTVAIRMLCRAEAQARKDGKLYEDQDTADGDLRCEALRDDWVEEHIDLIRAVRSLPRRQCEVIGLYYLLDYTTSETARMLGIQVATVRVHLHAALCNLRQHFGVPEPQRAPRRIPA